MNRLTILPPVLIAALGLSLGYAIPTGIAAPTHVAGSCSSAAAPVITSGMTETSDPNACPDGRMYWAIKLAIGDTLTVNSANSGPNAYGLTVYGPAAGTVGTPLCQTSTLSTAQLVCLAGAAGRYVLGTEGTGSFTPVVTGAPAQAGRVAGACDPAIAPIVRASVTQYAHTDLCGAAGTWQYWNIDLHIGDTVTLIATPVAQANSYSVELHLPVAHGAGGTALCDSQVPFTSGFPPDGQGQLACIIPRTGRYTIAVQNASAALTPSVLSAPPQAGRVTGGCSIATAPTINSGITQYGHTRLCMDTGEYQFWKLQFAPGDTLEVQAQVEGYANGRFLALYSPHTRTVSGSPLCSIADGIGPLTAMHLVCHVAHAGRYTLAFQNAAFAFTPLVVHPTRPVVTARVAGGAIMLMATIRSNTPRPTGTCLAEEAFGAHWSVGARVRTTTGICSARLVLTRRGPVQLRVHFEGARGWASSTSKSITVVR